MGACPGGTARDVITYLSGGDVPLSVGMTSVNMLLAPILTPAIAYLFLHTSVAVDVRSMIPSMAMATMPGAIFSVWHNISDAILANWFRKKKPGGTL